MMKSSASEESFKKIADSIRNKMVIAYNVLEACKKQAEYEMPVSECNDIYQKTSKLTDCDHSLLYKAISNKKPVRNIANRDIKQQFKYINLNYETYRNIYVDSYLKKLEIPNVQALKNELTTNRLKNTGFTWAKVPNTNKSMLIENAEQARRRMEYLSKIIAYRNSGKNIIYFEEKTEIFPISETENYSLNISGVSATVIGSKMENIVLFFYNDIKSFYSNKAIHNALSKKKDIPSVIVLADKNHHDKIMISTPTASDSKQSMIEFLIKSNIPHDPNMHRAELYTLIQKCKHNCEREYYKLDAEINAYGHEILRRPPLGLKQLNIFHQFWSEVNTVYKSGGYIYTKQSSNKTPKELNSKCIMKAAAQTIDSVKWEKMEADLIAYEKKIYTEDLQVEEIIDRIQTMALDGKVEDEDLPIFNTYWEENSNDDIIL